MSSLAILALVDQSANCFEILDILRPIGGFTAHEIFQTDDGNLDSIDLNRETVFPALVKALQAPWLREYINTNLIGKEEHGTRQNVLHTELTSDPMSDLRKRLDEARYVLLRGPHKEIDVESRSREAVNDCRPAANDKIVHAVAVELRAQYREVRVRELTIDDWSPAEI